MFKFKVQELEKLFSRICEHGYRMVGPTLRDETIVYDDIRSVNDLPRGWTDEQEAGRYRLRRRDDDALFGYNVGPHSWKNSLFLAREQLWRARADDADFKIMPTEIAPSKLAFIGVRSCDLHAIGIQDKIFIEGQVKDRHYASRREGALIIAVNCTAAGGTCFCVSMGNGPRVTKGYDLSLTEVIRQGDHFFLCDVGTDVGEALIANLSEDRATESDRATADRLIGNAESSMGRVLNTQDIKELLYRNLDNSRWDEVAKQCLSCGNCTLVCPTCFCSTVEDVTDLRGDNTERWRRWDSCFNLDHSFLHGGPVRATVKSRYRQWMTHKLASWIDQFGESGCVGCGRCITWCPVGIDITKEAAAIRSSEESKVAHET